jgi:hypothetical protein
VVRFPVGERYFSLLHNLQTSSGATQHKIRWVTRAVSPGVKRKGCEAEHTSI